MKYKVGKQEYVCIYIYMCMCAAQEDDEASSVGRGGHLSFHKLWIGHHHDDENGVIKIFIRRLCVLSIGRN